MSADNGIYITISRWLQSCYAQTIENIDYFPEDTQERKDVLKAYFVESPVFKTEEEAQTYAYKLEKDYSEEDEDFFYLEYGVCFVGSYESFI